MDIKIDKTPAEETLDKLQVKTWSVWEETVSEFPWEYAEDEICYILEGRVEVTPSGGQPVVIEKGDLVRFPAGMSCTWRILQDIKKYYSFE